MMSSLAFLVSQISILLLFFRENLYFPRYFENDVILNAARLKIFMGPSEDAPNLAL